MNDPDSTTTLNPLKTTSVSGSPAGAGAPSSATSPSAAASASAAGTPGSAGRPLSRAVVLASREDRSKNTLKGYLRKKSSKGAWQKRWFEASNHYLTYYKSLESNRILACIDLAKVGDVKMAPNAAADGPPFHFSIQLDERVYMMRAKTLSDANRWVEGLNRIKRSLVTLDELAQPDKPAASAAGTTAGAGAGGGAGAGVGAKHTQSSSSVRTAESFQVSAGVDKPDDRKKASCFCC